MSVLGTKYIVNEQGMIVEEIEINESEPNIDLQYDDMKDEKAENIAVNCLN